MSMIVNLQIILGIPITLMGDLARPKIFGSISPDPYVWLARIAGSLFLIFGVIYLKKNQAGGETSEVGNSKNLTNRRFEV